MEAAPDRSGDHDAGAEEGLYLGLTTRTAYGMEVARLLAAELARRLDLPHERAEAIELAVHEGLVNGLVHGNLGIAAVPRCSLEQFFAYCRQVERALSSEDGGARRIEVTARWDAAAVEVAVRDQGAGYDPQALPACAEGRRTSGRGLGLIAALTHGMTVAERGRKLTMRFPR